MPSSRPGPGRPCAKTSDDARESEGRATSGFAARSESNVERSEAARRRREAGEAERDKKVTTLRLTGHDLSIADVVAVARRNAAVALDRAAEHRVAEAAKLVAELASGGAPVYGVNTGFGDLATVRVPMERVRELQLNLVRSHAVGVGDPLPQDVVRAILLLRANTLATGRSGVKVATINLLLDMLDRGVHPVIPQHGSVGASGDLAPLAHAALVLIGEGEAFVDGVRLPGGDALKRKGLSPIELAPKEALALINGTQVMTAIGCLALH